MRVVRPVKPRKRSSLGRGDPRVLVAVATELLIEGKVSQLFPVEKGRGTVLEGSFWALVMYLD